MAWGVPVKIISAVEAKPTVAEIAAAVIAFIAATVMLINFRKEIRKSIEKLGDYLDKQTAYAEYYHNRYKDITYPQHIKAINDALSYEVIGPDYNNYPSWISIAQRHTNIATDFEQTIFGSYCINNFGICDKEIQNKTPTIAGDISFIESKVGERREERMRAEKWELIAATLRVINKEPDNIFRYINNAISIRQNLLGMASQGFNGAMATVGIELGTLHRWAASPKAGS